jgi:hypothetical protein
MQSTKITIGEVKVNLHKKPHEPIVFAKIDGNPVEISISDNVIKILSGEVPITILDKLKEIIAQYFLPLHNNKNKTTTASMKVTPEEIIAELQKQGVDEKYFKEGVSIILNRIHRTGCDLEVAVKSLIRWIGFAELP